MLYKLTAQYRKPDDMRITTPLMGNYDIIESAVVSCEPSTYWFITIQNFGYLYNSKRQLLDHYNLVSGTNTYKSHGSFAGGEMILTNDNKFKMVSFGSGLPVISFVTGSVEVNNQKLDFNWPVPKSECSNCLMMTPPGPYCDTRFERIIDRFGEVRGISQKGYGHHFQNLF